MDFLRAIINDIELDDDSQALLREIAEEQELDEAAIDRIEKRVQNREIALYRYLVGTSNVMLAKRFIELARDKKGIPSSVVKGYLPAIEAVDDIVKGGPAFVQALLLLQKRAKQNQKP